MLVLLLTSHVTLDNAKSLRNQISIKLGNLTKSSLWLYNFVIFLKKYFICITSSKLRWFSDLYENIKRHGSFLLRKKQIHDVFLFLCHMIFYHQFFIFVIRMPNSYFVYQREITLFQMRKPKLWEFICVRSDLPQITQVVSVKDRGQTWVWWLHTWSDLPIYLAFHHSRGQLQGQEVSLQASCSAGLAGWEVGSLRSRHWQTVRTVDTLWGMRVKLQRWGVSFFEETLWIYIWIGRVRRRRKTRSNFSVVSNIMSW